ncbi:class I SAM-dependent methyltransferase [Streptomyces sp. HK10]|uniref:class I SAM-dependent methyltransferase n=1 Tax=Streptomyces sp. HK10 TaxID=3373255 RepID=UPI0037496328
MEDPEDRRAWQGLRASYEYMAKSWREWTDEQPGYDLPVREGLRRARPAPWAVEICCGTGEATAAIAEVVPTVTACDLNPEMLRRRAGTPHGVQWMVADVRSLPFDNGQVPLVVSLNGVFYPAELARVLVPGGQLLWCTSFGEGTPLYVSPERMHQMLGPQWGAENGRAGHGQWALFTAPAA